MHTETIESLKNKIWLTRKSRIRASERLVRSDSYSKLMLSYYSFATLTLSIVQLRIKNLPSGVSLLDVLLGVLLFGTAIYVNTLNFSSRASAMKRCYLILDQLYLELDQLPSGDELDGKTRRIVESVGGRYALEESENHSEYDYFGAVLAADGPTRLTKFQRVRYRTYRLVSLILLGILIAFPIGVGLWAVTV